MLHCHDGIRAISSAISRGRSCTFRPRAVRNGFPVGALAERPTAVPYRLDIVHQTLLRVAGRFANVVLRAVGGKSRIETLRSTGAETQDCVFEGNSGIRRYDIQKDC